MPLLQGVTDLAAALVVGKIFGLAGVAASGLVSSVLVALPLGCRVLRRGTGLAPGQLATLVFVPWAVRAGPLLLVGLVTGVCLARLPLVCTVVVAPLVAILYLRVMWPLCGDVPLPARLQPLLERLRVLRFGSPEGPEVASVPPE